MLHIPVGARNSPLSLAQCDEGLQELHRAHSNVIFDLQAVATSGDKDKATSLRALDKTDFFTKEIDEMLLKGQCRIAIHSAKDLPDPLPEGLVMIALTRGVDPRDALVMRFGDTFASLPVGAVIATSSERREAMVRALRPDFCFKDLRGTIGERLEKLKTGEADGVVAAEAALIRLKLTHLNRMIIPGETALHQGQLAIMARQEDREMAELFACLDVRQAKKRRILYLGLKAPRAIQDEEVVHCPIIQIVPRPFDLGDLSAYTHLIFTSKTAVDLFSEKNRTDLKGREILAVGHATALRLLEKGFHVTQVAQDERAEGLIELLEGKDLSCAHIFFPHSAKARPVLKEYLEKHKVRYRECLLYDPLPLKPEPLPDLAQFDEIVFTSPSTVDAFLQFFGQLRVDKKLKCIGQITEEYLQAKKPPVAHS